MKNGKVAEAVALTERRKYYHPSEVALIIEAGEQLEAAGGPEGSGEIRVAMIADNLVRVARPHRTPPVPTPFDERIAEAEAAGAERLAEIEAAQAKLWDLQDVAYAATHKGQPAPEDLRWQILDAERDVFDADQAWLRVRSRVVALQLARDRWRSETTARFHNPADPSKPLTMDQLREQTRQ